MGSGLKRSSLLLAVPGPAVSLTWRAFGVAFLIGFVPTLFFGLIAAWLAPELAPDYLGPTWKTAILGSIEVAVLAPLIETCLLVYATALARQAIQRHWWACVVGALPVVLLHLWIGWAKVLVVAWTFVWWAHCNIELAARGASLRQRMFFLVGLHALANTLSLVVLLALKAWGS